MSGDHHFHISEPRFSAVAHIGPVDPALPRPSGSMQHVRQIPVLWPESGVEWGRRVEAVAVGLRNGVVGLPWFYTGFREQGDASEGRSIFGAGESRV